MTTFTRASRFVFGLLLAATPLLAQDDRPGEVRYLIVGPDQESVELRLQADGRFVVQRSSLTGLYGPVRGRATPASLFAVRRALSDGTEPADPSRALTPRLLGRFTLEWDGRKVEADRGNLAGNGNERFRLALEELEGIRDRALGEDLPLSVGGIERRLLRPHEAAEVVAIRVYRDGKVFLTLASSEEEPVRRISGALTHAERKRLDAALRATAFHAEVPGPVLVRYTVLPQREAAGQKPLISVGPRGAYAAVDGALDLITWRMQAQARAEAAREAELEPVGEELTGDGAEGEAPQAGPPGVGAAGRLSGALGD